MKKIILTIIAIAVWSFSASAQTASGSVDYAQVIRETSGKSVKSFDAGDYEDAELWVRQAITIFESQSRDFQESNAGLKAELYYDLTRSLSLQGKVDEAVDTFAEAVDYGWDNYAFAKGDSDLKPLRKNKKFKSIMLAIKNK